MMRCSLAPSSHTPPKPRALGTGVGAKVDLRHLSFWQPKVYPTPKPKAPQAALGLHLRTQGCLRCARAGAHMSISWPCLSASQIDRSARPMACAHATCGTTCARTRPPRSLHKHARSTQRAPLFPRTAVQGSLACGGLVRVYVVVRRTAATAFALRRPHAFSSSHTTPQP